MSQPPPPTHLYDCWFEQEGSAEARPVRAPSVREAAREFCRLFAETPTQGATEQVAVRDPEGQVWVVPMEAKAVRYRFIVKEEPVRIDLTFAQILAAAQECARSWLPKNPHAAINEMVKVVKAYPELWCLDHDDYQLHMIAGIPVLIELWIKKHTVPESLADKVPTRTS